MLEQIELETYPFTTHNWQSSHMYLGLVAPSPKSLLKNHHDKRLCFLHNQAFVSFLYAKPRVCFQVLRWNIIHDCDIYYSWLTHVYGNDTCSAVSMSSFCVWHFVHGSLCHQLLTWWLLWLYAMTHSYELSSISHGTWPASMSKNISVRTSTCDPQRYIYYKSIDSWYWPELSDMDHPRWHRHSIVDHMNSKTPCSLFYYCGRMSLASWMCRKKAKHCSLSLSIPKSIRLCD